MLRRSSRILLAAVALIAGGTVVRCADDSLRQTADGAEKTASGPNIVVILADDVGFSDFGCYGSEIATPHIDRLAREGLKFTHFYNNSVCVPSRAALITGLYPRYIGPSHRIALTDAMVTIPEVLREAGYRTVLSGKRHLGREPPHHPLDRGFEEYYGLLDGCCNYFDPARRDPMFEGGRFRFWAHNRQRITEFPGDFYSTDAITDHAIRNIRQFAASRQPFFAWVCYTAAHSPLHARPADIARYRGRYVAGWDELRRRRHERQLALGVVQDRWKPPQREPESLPWREEPLKEWNENLMSVYAAMIDSMDQGIGRILQSLEETQADRNTIVIVLCDNGGCAEQAGGDDPTNIAGPKEHYVSCGAGWAYAQNTPFRRYKSWCHEGGIATPMVVRWPGVVPAGRTTHQVGHLMDLMPTLVELAGAKYPAERNGRRILPHEGRSLAATWRGSEKTEERKLYWNARGGRALRDGKWKIAWDSTIARWELYDMAADRTETTDLAGTWCLMPNHWHLVLWPREDGDLSRFTGWLTLTHTQRWHAHRNSAGTGHLYQGRFKSFPVQEDEHFLSLCRYVERNALRARLCQRAEEWRWGSLHRYVHGGALTGLLHPWPIRRSVNWVDFVNAPQTEAEVGVIRRSIRRGSPYGDDRWTERAAVRLGLESTLKPIGRPPKPTKPA